ncbi:aminotransferase [Nocardioides baekrokdamisoli]|uniref:Aminotransferase n=1 Tax=Nocardioides baekrokdamisoli TaxID=1804624 RepID=A0A3G9IEF1_9ACTN|nr:succinyldiaminopimelate transaminase [Nocardioides baekrokdamisoli]BBH16726.1 aminotransferase [Nocardioides baekrokdamisoli]
MKVSDKLPDFPWDKLTAYAATARSHPDGIVDLSIGTPVDPTPEVAKQALRDAADWPGYPTTIGLTETRQAVIDWFARVHDVTGLGLDQVLPVIGTKELIAQLALHLGIGEGDLVVFPEAAYPTYEVGAALAGATGIAADSLTALGPQTPKVLWLNSPSNPTGRILPADHLKKVVDWCRERGVLLVSDECYLDCVWEGETISVLHPSISGGSADGILVVHSLSKRSNLAGYRAGFVAGDAGVIAELLAVRKNLGLIVPGPVQQVMTAVYADDAHAAEQHARYAARRTRLKAALERAGFTVDHSEAALYLWSTRGEDCWKTVGDLADLGILVAPGEFYGTAGRQHVRIAITATDERIDAAVARLTA